MRALVTGGTGFIGSHLVKRLVADGWDVHVVDKRVATESRHCRGVSSIVVGSMLEFDLREAVQGQDVVFHLAGQPGVQPSWSRYHTYLTDNLLTTQQLLEAVRGLKGHKPRVVVASSSSVYQGASPYALTKRAVEELVDLYARTFDLDAVCLRYFTVYGPEQRPDMLFAKAIRAARGQSGPLTVFDRAMSRDFTYVDDAVTTTIEAGLGRYLSRMKIDVGSARPIAVSTALETLERVLGIPIPRETTPTPPGEPNTTSAPYCCRLTGSTWSLEEGLREQVNATR